MSAAKVEASTEPQDMRLQRLLGHLSRMNARHPNDVLVGFWRRRHGRRDQHPSHRERNGDLRGWNR